MSTSNWRDYVTDAVLVKCAIAVLIFQLSLLPLYLKGIIYYNPLLKSTDIVSNFLALVTFLMVSKRIWLSLVFLYLLYGIGLLNFYFLRKNISLTDFESIRELVLAYPGYFTLISISSLTVVVMILCSKIKISLIERKIKLNEHLRKRVLLCLASFLLCSFLFPSPIYAWLRDPNADAFEKGAIWRFSGQIYSIYYDFVDRSTTSRVLSKHEIVYSPFNLDIQAELRTRPNIYVVLLESFSAEWESDFGVAQDWTKKGHARNFVSFSHRALSPTFGGFSAMSEFELLCGIPELSLLGTITFNYLGSKDARFCLPNLLSTIGYKTIAITGTKPYFFNARNAYSALGFSEFYSKDYHGNSDNDGVHPSDRTLYMTALSKSADVTSPIFMYIVTAAGHHPYDRDEITRPNLIEGHHENKYVNRLIYSHLEFTDFVRKIKAKDRDALVVGLSDHNTAAGRRLFRRVIESEREVSMYLSFSPPHSDLFSIPFFNVSRILLAEIADKNGRQPSGNSIFMVSNSSEVNSFIKANRNELEIANLNIIKKSRD